jgi:hypothetical protein
MPAALQQPVSGPTQGGVAESVEAARAGQLDPFYANLAKESAARAVVTAAVTVAQPDTTNSKRISRRTRLGGGSPDAAPDAAVVADAVAGPAGDNDLSAVPVSAAAPAGDDAIRSASDALTASQAIEEAPVPTPAVQYVGDVNRPPVPADPIDLRTALPAATQSHAPAASDTDSPSRGVPRPNVANQRPGKEITGGFADQAAMQYFALDGRELGILVQDMLVELHQRIDNDLRFTEAIVYPRVAVKCSVEVSGFGMDNSFTVDKIVKDAGLAAGDPLARQTPIELARQVADEVVFVLVAAKSETDANGEPLDPPDKIRIELNLKRPRKQVVIGVNGTRQMVDVVG